jgi:hypothetical protein
MQAALRALNQLVTDGVIPQYAIGGAIGASFYIDAVQTEDVDAFVFMSPSATGLLTLAPIYEALTKLGGVVEHEYIRFAEWPVQILPDANDLVREAISNATKTEFDGIPTRVFSAEHLCAVALQTGRTKDYLRVVMFLEAKAVDRKALELILKQHGLESKMIRVDAMMEDLQ